MMVCVRGRVCAKLGGTAGVNALVPATILLGDKSFFIAAGCETARMREYNKKKEFPPKSKRRK
jgi:hypothetical protein